MYRQEIAGFSPCVQLPVFHFGDLFLTDTHSLRVQVPSLGPFHASRARLKNRFFRLPGRCEQGAGDHRGLEAGSRFRAERPWGFSAPKQGYPSIHGGLV